MPCSFSKYSLIAALSCATVHAAPKPVAQMPIPLFFEANRGQAPAEAKFIAHHGGMSVLLEESGPVLRLPSSEIRMKLTGDSRRPAQLEAVDPTESVSSYFFGNEPSKWRTNIPQSRRVRYKQVYPGTDLVFRASTDSRFEYDFVVAPGADPSQIEFRFDGADSVETDGAGGIILRTADGKILEPRPRIYQDGGKEIDGRMILGSNNTIRFELGDYDRTRELVIDPLIIQWLTIGTVDDQFDGIGRDSAGNVYVTGITKSASYPGTQIGSPNTNYYHVFVAKLNASLTNLTYYAVIGGMSNDYAAGLSVDSAGNAYVVGTANSVDFPVLHGAQTAFGSKQTTGQNFSNDAFALKLNPAGTALAYSTFIGGNADDEGLALAVDSTGSVYAMGITTSFNNFPITQGGISMGPVLYQNLYNAAVFVAKISPDGGTFNYVAVFGASSIANPTAIAIDSSGNAYVAGYLQSQGLPADFPIAGNPIQPTRASNMYNNGFISALNPKGSGFLFSTYFPGSGGTDLLGIGLDSKNNIYVVGDTLSLDLPVTAGAVVPTLAPNPAHGAAFIASLNNSATAILACSYLGLDGSQADAVTFPSPGAIGVTGGGATSFAGVSGTAANDGLLGAAYVTLDPKFQNVLSSFSPFPYAAFYSGAAIAPDGSVALGASTQLLPTTSGTLGLVNRNAPVILVDPGAGSGTTTNTTPSILPGGVASAAAFGGSLSIAPGTWIEIYGSNLASDSRSWATTDFNGSNAPTSLDGTSVTIGGVPAFVDYIGTGQNGQVNALVPSTVATGQQPLIVKTPNGSTSAYMVNVNTIQPGILAPASFNIGGVQYAVAILADGSYALPVGAIAGVNSRPAKPGDTVVLYGIGFGPVTPSMNAGVVVNQSNHLTSSFSMSVAGVQGTLGYYGLAPGFTGLYQFNLTIPQVAPGNSALTFNLGGSTGSQTLYIATGN